MYGHLPTLHIEFSDTGTMFNSAGFSPGSKIFIELVPAVEDDTIPEPYVKGIYVIQYFRYITGIDSQTYTYTIDCMFGAYGFTNNIVTWPLNVTTNLLSEHDDTSDEVIKQIASKAGLTSVADVTGDDSMLWVNSNKTCEEFIKFITEHAWVGKYDAPLYYIDHNGTLYYTSLKTMCDKASMATYMDTMIYNRKLDSGEVDTYYRTYQDAMVEDHGYLSNEGAYKDTSYLYNPYCSVLDAKEQVSIALNGYQTIGVKGNANSYLCYKYYTTDKADAGRGNFIVGQSNDSVGAGDTTRYNSNDIRFKQTHLFYDVAPLHNRNFIKGFFQVFAYLTINNATQVNKDTDPSQRVKLGDKITIDFTSTDTESSIQTGDYIVAGIVHKVVARAAYTTMIVGVRDTLTKTKKLLTGTDTSSSK